MTEIGERARPTRLAGAGHGPDGALVAWSLAEGGRGRRWRSTRTFDGRLVSVLLLEVTPAGRPSRLELTTAAGLLTLHPNAAEDALHGNVVAPGGVRHLAFGWSADHALIVLDEPVAAAALGPDGVRISRTGRLVGLRVDPDLAIESVVLAVQAPLPESPSLPDLRDGAVWPLESD